MNNVRLASDEFDSIIVLCVIFSLIGLKSEREREKKQPKILEFDMWKNMQFVPCSEYALVCYVIPTEMEFEIFLVR